MNCGSPSTIRVSLAEALRRSLDLALATVLWKLRTTAAPASFPHRFMMSVGVHLGVPDVQGVHPGKGPHRLAVAREPAMTTAARSVDVMPRARPATSKLAPRRLRSHSKGPGEGLVEVVDVEDHVALGRGEAPEVDQVGVPAELDLEARCGGSRPGRPPSPPPPPGRRRRARRPSGRSGSGPGRASGWWPGGPGRPAGPVGPTAARPRGPSAGRRRVPPCPPRRALGACSAGPGPLGRRSWASCLPGRLTTAPAHGGAATWSSLGRCAVARRRLL